MTVKLKGRTLGSARGTVKAVGQADAAVKLKQARGNGRP